MLHDEREAGLVFDAVHGQVWVVGREDDEYRDAVEARVDTQRTVRGEVVQFSNFEREGGDLLERERTAPIPLSLRAD